MCSMKKFQLSFWLIIFLLCSLIFSSCTYKFSLLARKKLGKYNSIYIATPINYAGSHLPLEFFETEIEKSFVHYFPDLVLSLTQKQIFIFE